VERWGKRGTLGRGTEDCLWRQCTSSVGAPTVSLVEPLCQTGLSRGHGVMCRGAGVGGRFDGSEEQVFLRLCHSTVPFAVCVPRREVKRTNNQGFVVLTVGVQAKAVCEQGCGVTYSKTVVGREEQRMHAGRQLSLCCVAARHLGRLEQCVLLPLNAMWNRHDGKTGRSGIVKEALGWLSPRVMCERVFGEQTMKDYCYE
jgi:hypothetical protein